jgi:hypothetical protein
MDANLIRIWSLSLVVAVFAGARTGGLVAEHLNTKTAVAPAARTASAADPRCAESGDAVSAFTCRNTWMAYLKTSYR